MLVLYMYTCCLQLIWQYELLENMECIPCQKIYLYIMHDPSPNLSKQIVCLSEGRGFYLHLRRSSWCSTWENCVIYFFYVCQHCTVHWRCICKMIYLVQHHSFWSHVDEKGQRREKRKYSEVYSDLLQNATGYSEAVSTCRTDIHTFKSDLHV